jgi:hypothetical protein
MSSDEAEIDAVVDSILLRSARSSSSPPAYAAVTSAFTPVGVHHKRGSPHAPSIIPTATAAVKGGHGAAVDTSIWNRIQPPVAHATDVRKATGVHAVKGDTGEGEEEDLNALVERILAGPGPAVVSYSQRSDDGPTTATVQAMSSGSQSSPSISPASSSPRYQLPQSYAQPLHQQQKQQRPQLHVAQQEQQQQQRRASISESSGAASRRTGGGGATRADTSLSRASGRGLLSTSSAAAATSSSSPMDAVVRRLTLWQERREAKRVQSVYEALEKEHEECTFEPSINRLAIDGDGSRSLSSGHRNYHSTEEAEEEECEGDEEGRQRPPWVSLSASRARSSSHHMPNDTYARMRGSTSASSHVSGVSYVPSLLPPEQPIYGVEAFVERLRTAQADRDAVKAAEEAKRLRYYDPTTFKRDVTVPKPFELGDTRPRRAASSTVPVPGVPSPLARLRALSPSAEGGNGYALGTAATLTGSPFVRAGSHAVAGRSPFPCALGSLTYQSNDADDGGGDTTAAAVAVPYETASGDDEEEAKRMTAENTFLSLAPQIRESLLFDRGMEHQLHRATESIRRGMT